MQNKNDVTQYILHYTIQYTLNMNTKLNDTVIEHYIKRYYETNKQEYKDYDFMTVLLERHGDNALLHACKYSRTSTVRYLVENGVNVNIKDEEHGYTPLLYACKHKFPSTLIKALLSAGANVHDREYIFNDTPLLTACKHDAPLKTIQLLIESGSNVNTVNKKGNSAIYYLFNDYTVKDNYGDRIKYLAKSGARLNMTNDMGYTPLMYYCNNTSYEECIQCLIDCVDRQSVAAFVNQYGSNNFTALHLASKRYDAYNISMRLVDTLVKNGADVNIKDKCNCTALMYAAESSNFSTVEYLVKHDAIIDQCALEYIKRYCHDSEIKQYIIKQN